MQKISLLFFTLLAGVWASSLSPNVSNNSLIVYNSNVALVHEERELSLKRSDTSIVYKGVASSIDTSSVNVELPQGITLFSQQYRYDKLTQVKLLETYLGKEVQVGKKHYTLLAHNGKSALVQNKKAKIISVASKDIIFSAVPRTLLTKPSLVWNVTVDKNIDSKMKLDYLIRNISWSSDYILNLDGESADLIGWITLKNNSGKAFKDTKLYVLAGDINRATSKRPQVQKMYARAMADTPVLMENAHEGYHLYSVGFKVNLANNEKTQIKFMSQKSLDTKRKYSAFLSNPLYAHGEKTSDVTQYITLKGLSEAVPKGVVRTYSKFEGTSILLGETNIGHTPKNTPIQLKLGKNFDVKVTQTVLKRDDRKHYLNADVKYVVKNESDTVKEIELLVPFNKKRDSRVTTKKKFSYVKGNILRFKVRVEANSSKSFRANFDSKR